MPSDPSRLASRYAAGFDCPRCSLYGAQEWTGLFQGSTDSDSAWSEPFTSESPQTFTFDMFAPTVDPWDAPSGLDGGQVMSGYGSTPVLSWRVPEQWAASKCSGCTQSTVWHSDSIVYPVVNLAPIPNRDMPTGPKELYLEAAAVMVVSRRAGAAMARATLERLLIELDPSSPKGARLDDRIIRVLDKVSTSLGEALTIIRHVGNVALHGDPAPDDALVLILDEENTEIIDVLFAAINDLVDELVTRPAVRARLLNAVPRTVRDAVDRKEAAARNRDNLPQ